MLDLHLEKRPRDIRGLLAAHEEDRKLGGNHHFTEAGRSERQKRNSRVIEVLKEVVSEAQQQLDNTGGSSSTVDPSFFNPSSSSAKPTWKTKTTVSRSRC